MKKENRRRKRKMARKKKENRNVKMRTESNRKGKEIGRQKE